MPAAWAHNAVAALAATGADLAPSLDALSMLREGPHAAFDALALRRLVDDASSADQDLQAACCCCIVSWSAVLFEFNHACGKGSLLFASALVSGREAGGGANWELTWTPCCLVKRSYKQPGYTPLYACSNTETCKEGDNVQQPSMGMTRVAQTRPVLCSEMVWIYQWSSCSSMGARRSRQAAATAAMTAALMMVETASPTMTTWSTTVTLARPVLSA